MSTPMIQLSLIQGDTLLTTWVDKRTDLKVGKYLSLKGQEGRWKIHRMYDVEVMDTHLNNQRAFDNNNYDKHVGLFNNV